MSKRRAIRPKDIINPSRIFDNLINDYVEGNLDDYSILFRALVVEVDTIGGQLSDENEPKNPPNSIKARILTKDRNREVDDLDIFWPLFPHDIMPVKEGEHVFVMFEDAQEEDGGLWIARIPEPDDVNSANLVEGKKKYEDSDKVSSIGADQVVQDVESDPDTITRDENFVVEDVPKFKFRVGDRVIEGSNNTIIVLGRDRPSDVDSGQKDGAGTIDIVAGRDGEDANMADDKSRIYVSSNTDPDENFEITVGDTVSATAAIVVKSDEIRIVANGGMKIVVEGDLRIDAKNILIGATGEPLLMGDQLKTFLATVGSVQTTGGPGSIALPPNVFTKNLK